MDHALPWAVVYVDDEQFNLQELEDALRPRLQNPIKLFNDAQDFIDWVGHTTERIGALLIDLIMPGMSGLELIQWCKEHRPDLRPLIIVTGLQDKYSQKQARKVGADAYLIKPVTVGTFLNALTELEHNKFEVHRTDNENAPTAAETIVAPAEAIPLKKGVAKR